MELIAITENGELAKLVPSTPQIAAEIAGATTQLYRAYSCRSLCAGYRERWTAFTSKHFVAEQFANVAKLSETGARKVKRLLIGMLMLVLLFVAAQSQSRIQTTARKDEPPIDCGAYPAQATSLYILPYRVGESYEVITTTEHYVRGNGGVGLNAVDFQMPIGTPVVAARAGIIVALQEDYADDNGIDLQENYLFIKHSDGSIGRYFHLTRQGALVEVGDSVRQGEVIARSGNSGQSPVPHLHFDVQMCGLNLPPNYNQLPCGQTLPVTFRNTSRHICGLITGSSYTARRFNVQTSNQQRRTSRSNGRRL